MVSETITTPLAERTPGVLGEYHSQGGIVLAAQAARRLGFPGDRMWYIGDPTTDPLGEDIGFVLPVSVIRESALAGTILGVVIGALIGLSLGQRFGGVLGDAIAGGVVGLGLGWFLAWSHLSSRLGAYLMKGTAGGLHLKIGLPTDVPETEQERLAEMALQVLRSSNAETILHVHASREVNSPQSPTYIAVPPDRAG